jgi:hypothetical protein
VCPLCGWWKDIKPQVVAPSQSHSDQSKAYYLQSSYETFYNSLFKKKIIFKDEKMFF